MWNCFNCDNIIDDKTWCSNCGYTRKALRKIYILYLSTLIIVMGLVYLIGEVNA